MQKSEPIPTAAAVREQHKALVAEMVRQLENPTPAECAAQERAAAELGSQWKKSGA